MSRIREEYIETGKVQFVYKHFAILGPESNSSAEASECAAEQGEFWAYHDILFTDTSVSFTAEKLTELAGQIGLDTAAFTECLNSGRYAAQVSQESLSIQSLGVRGTPAFLLNGIFISGAQPFEAFQQVIDEQLLAAAAQPPASTNPEAASPTSPIETPASTDE